jgi:hypothetical protein
MKYLKLFENFENKTTYQIGDYIILNNDSDEWRVNFGLMKMKLSD